MKRRYHNLICALCFAVLEGLLFGCSTTVDPSIKMGTAEFHITDAPLDDDNVKGVFMTVTDVKVNGTSIADFTKQTVDVKALQDGRTQLIGTSTFIATSFQSITLTIDTDTDAAGGTPGTYVQTFDDTKYKLRSNGQATVTIDKRWTVPPNAKSIIVIDMDLRKVIVDATDPAVKYRLVDDAVLNTFVRLVTKELTGTISGTYVEKTPVGADKVIAYAYKPGTFVASIEGKGQTADSIYFKNAITSAVVRNDSSPSTYTLALLESGDYEIHLAAYKKSSGSDKYIFKGVLQASTTFGGSVVSSITIRPGFNASVSTTVTGL